MGLFLQLCKFGTLLNQIMIAGIAKTATLHFNVYQQGNLKFNNQIKSDDYDILTHQYYARAMLTAQKQTYSSKIAI